MSHMCPKLVYFIKPVGMDGPVKIGCTKFPKDRLQEIARWSPFPLEIVAIGEGDHKLEFFIHRKFAHLRIHHEWFSTSEELLSAIDAVKRGDSVADAFCAELRIRKSRVPTNPNNLKRYVASPRPAPAERAGT